jgi:hypothetical protein
MNSAVSTEAAGSHVASIADALAFTIAQMARIDAAWRGAFPDRA